jgi:hypothetical protein
MNLILRAQRTPQQISFALSQGKDPLLHWARSKDEPAFFELTQGKNPSFTGHNCILDPTLPAPIRCIKVFQGLTIFSYALIPVYKIFYPCNTIRAILHFGNSFS